MSKVTRREIVTGGFLKRLVSHRSEPEGDGRIAGIVEIPAEIMCAGMMLWLAYRGSKDKLSWWEVQPPNQMQENPDFRNTLRDINNVANIVPDVAKTTVELSRLWDDECHKTRIVPTLDCDANGHCTPGLKSERYWAEPDQLTALGINHSSLSDLASYFTNFQNKINQVQASAASTPTYLKEQDHLNLLNT